MNRAVRWTPAGLILAALLWSAPAHAGARLGLGADYWIDEGGVFEFMIGVDTPVARHLSVGGRFGALLDTTHGTNVGVPIDLYLRAYLARHRIYIEGMGGPWLIFERGPVHAHGAFGFGFNTSDLELGFEVGWLQPDPHIGLRLAFRL